MSDARFGRIEDKLDEVLRVMGKLPSRAEMIGYGAAAFALAVAIVAVIVGAMGWLETRAARLEAPTTSAPASVAVPALSAPSQTK